MRFTWIKLAAGFRRFSKCFCLCCSWTFRAKPEPRIPWESVCGEWGLFKELTKGNDSKTFARGTVRTSVSKIWASDLKFGIVVNLLLAEQRKPHQSSWRLQQSCVHSMWWDTCPHNQSWSEWSEDKDMFHMIPHDSAACSRDPAFLKKLPAYFMYYVGCYKNKKNSQNSF